MDATKVRINASLVEKYQGKLVRLIGKCQSFDPINKIATLDSNGEVRLEFFDEVNLAVGKIYEITGKVSSNEQKVHAQAVTELSDNTNLEIADKLVSYSQKVPELFIES
ncbi:predicted protein [Scheffersomyces stipitis CBS 6054]|uniref:Replication factor A protein 3 n=1 Tax=Scheffersomyces stipitis (strain ATCC 58785 / CBS 6054 / NBRC 10063 / NRRL Y-11545) TaxID=322104 RepID=A3LYT3_PICST|nr:predicted protein [Scheffersomyces stipitis CBS 6054]ABN68224.2 predicted protein [Scheffersomyces stipitis CBS 6054]KAG2731358.1 hypothetical protein G9P44_005774 [Scheffersomyces stipitis]